EKGEFSPPLITDLKLSYSPPSEGQRPEHILTENNLQVQIKKPKDIFRPFEFLSDKYPALYFCFTEPLKKGPYSFYIDVDRYYTYPDNEPLPTVKWQYFSKDGNWKNLNVLDETRGLTRSGMIMFSLEDEMSHLTLFGIDKVYWIRGVITDTSWSLCELSAGGNVASMIKELYLPGFTPLLYLSISRILTKSRILSDIQTQKKIYPAPGDNKKIPADDKEVADCEEEIPLVIKNLAKEDVKKVPPVINGIYLNAVIAVQTETIEDEALGSSSGRAGETFQTARTPVINEILWINELNSLSEAERSELKKEPDMVKEEYNEQGQLTGFWVRWNAVESFIDSTPADRHYIIDRVSGEVVFGDGNHSKIPPAGTDNIRLTYKTGGGKRGNLSAGEIKELQSAIPFIDNVYNPVASAGGCNTEDTEVLIKRGSSHLRHRNRAVSVQDYYDLAFEASRSIARVKVIPDLDDKLEHRRGHITIVIVPYSDEAMPLATSVLKKQLKGYVEERACNLAKIHVVNPAYIKINVQAELTTKRIDMIPTINTETTKKTREFLHPLRGGKDGIGWEFGKVPCLSDLYVLIQGIEGVEYVSTISLVLITEDGSTYRVYQDKYLLPSYSLIYPGDMDIKIKLMDKEETG
ncbi:MAG: putative baseplate assembly protein, partial [Nitrospirae bacterium]|nr:putative baseplate assembly protein [Nitrospirota bacterium]